MERLERVKEDGLDACGYQACQLRAQTDNTGAEGGRTEGAERGHHLASGDPALADARDEDLAVTGHARAQVNALAEGNVGPALDEDVVAPRAAADGLVKVGRH